MTDQEIPPLADPPPIPDWLRNLLYGIGQVACIAILENAANNRGFDQGVKVGSGKGVLMTLDCAKHRFGSKLMRLLSEEVERRHGEELLG